MIVENKIIELRRELDMLQECFAQFSANQVPLTGKTDTAYGKCPQVDSNTENISSNSTDILTTQEGLAQTYEETQANAQDILATQEGLAETYEETYTSITNLEEAIAEVYEMILPTE